jgi:hypothetical protein
MTVDIIECFVTSSLEAVQEYCKYGNIGPKEVNLSMAAILLDF